MNWARKVCEMILFIGGPVDWGVGAGMGDMDGRHWIPWERLRDSPELSGRVKISLND